MRSALALSPTLLALLLLPSAGSGPDALAPTPAPARAVAASPAPAPAPAVAERAPVLHLPWKEAGLSPREAAAHLLNRFAYGPRPGEIEKVLAMGLDRWVERQLAADLPDPAVARLLDELPAWEMTPEQIARLWPDRRVLVLEARRAGVIEAPERRGKTDMGDAAASSEEGQEDEEEVGEADPRARREALARFARQQGYRPERELLEQLLEQKIGRAVVSENQLQEVMTDFWFNHFNVSATDNQARGRLLTYERDAIRPHALGRLRDLLGATARHPAMLLYLDNAQSSAAPEAATTLDGERDRRRPRMAARRRGTFGPDPGGFSGPGGPPGRFGALGGRPRDEGGQAPAQRRRPQGLNENYARELLELHTLGVDGGYTQKDVTEVARAFTGWSVVPPRALAGQGMERRLARLERQGGLGFVQEGEFLFRADRHDAGEKTVLGKRLPAGRGIEDGEAVLDLLAAHPSTGRHLAQKLAVRFVADEPPAALVDRLARVFAESRGDTRRLLVALVESPEFWRRETVGAKIKSPFELAASALRATGAELAEPRAVLAWIRRMGQPLYAYQAPTGFPDRADAWVNTGSLLNRMSFGLQLAAARVRGVEVDLPALNGGREPESREAALATYAALLLPGGDGAATVERLRPMVADPNLAQKIDQAAPLDDAEDGMAARPRRTAGAGAEERRQARRERALAPADLHPPTPLEQVVGVILGSPDFQRR